MTLAASSALIAGTWLLAIAFSALVLYPNAPRMPNWAWWPALLATMTFACSGSLAVLLTT